MERSNVYLSPSLFLNIFQWLFPFGQIIFDFFFIFGVLKAVAFVESKKKWRLCNRIELKLEIIFPKIPREKGFKTLFDVSFLFLGFRFIVCPQTDIFCVFHFVYFCYSQQSVH